MSNYVPANLEEMSMSQMVEFYNARADKPVKKFKDRATAIERITRQAEELDKAVEEAHEELNEAAAEWSEGEEETSLADEEPTEETKSTKKGLAEHLWNLLNDNGPLSVGEMMDLLEVSDAHVRSLIGQLRKSGHPINNVSRGVFGIGSEERYVPKKDKKAAA